MKRALSLVLAVVMVFSLALTAVAADVARAAAVDSGTDSGPVDSGAVTITFDLNYDGAPAAEKAETEAGGKVTCPFTEDELARGGYTFGGWYREQNPGTSSNAVDLDTAAFNEDTTLYAKWNEIKVPAGMNKEDVSIEGAPEGATLTITDQGLTNTETSVREEIEKFPNVEIAPESPVVIYDISLDVTGGNVTVTLPVPKGLDASKTIMALHFAKDGTEALTVKIVDGKMQFTVDSFSEFAFFNADEAAASDKDVRVTVNTSKNGVLDITTVGDTGMEGPTKILPVGETTILPYTDPTTLRVRGGYTGVAYLTIDYIAADGYTIDTVTMTGTGSDGQAINETFDLSDHIGDNYYPNPGDELTFTATFKEDTSYNQYTEEYYVAASPSDYPVKTGDYAPGEISSELEFWYWNETTGEDRQLTPATFEIDTANVSGDADKFEIRDGKLVNKVALPGTEETYSVPLKVTYNGKVYTYKF